MPAPVCPLPFADYPTVLLAHGSGGRLIYQLLEQLILPALGVTAHYTTTPCCH